jgi:hypothetical protein
MHSRGNQPATAAMPGLNLQQLRSEEMLDMMPSAAFGANALQVRPSSP